MQRYFKTCQNCGVQVEVSSPNDTSFPFYCSSTCENDSKDTGKIDHDRCRTNFKPNYKQGKRQRQ